jgi:tRNA splicing endonuclease
MVSGVFIFKKKDKNKIFGFGSNFHGELGDFNQHQLSPIEINILTEKKIMKLRTGGSHITLLLGN